MSKAEERAREFFPNEDSNSIKTKFGFLLGYHQAEKDLELTVDDIKNIDRLLNQFVDCSNPYQEVLKRFNKERKEK